MLKVNSKKKRAFTLIELLVVIAILAVLAAIAIPRYNNSRQKSQITAHNTNVQTLKSAASMAIADGYLDFEWSGPGTGGDCKADDYIEKYPQVPKGAIKGRVVSSGKDYYKVSVKDGGKINVSPDEVEVNSN